MTNERFWEIVDSVGWPVENTDEAKRDIMMNTAPIEIDEFQEELKTKVGALRDLFDEEVEEMDEDFYVSGDGLDDCVYHIVGLGREDFENAIKFPQKIVERYREGEYEESFSYAIPYVTDYDKLGTDYYQYRSAKYVDGFHEIGKKDKFAKDYRQKAQRMAAALESFPFVQSLPNRWERAGLIDEATEDAVLDRMAELEEELEEDSGTSHGVRNLVSDFRTFYAYNQ